MWSTNFLIISFLKIIKKKKNDPEELIKINIYLPPKRSWRPGWRLSILAEKTWRRPWRIPAASPGRSPHLPPRRRPAPPPRTNTTPPHLRPPPPLWTPCASPFPWRRHSCCNRLPYLEQCRRWPVVGTKVKAGQGKGKGGEREGEDGDGGRNSKWGRWRLLGDLNMSHEMCDINRNHGGDDARHQRCMRLIWYLYWLSLSRSSFHSSSLSKANNISLYSLICSLFPKWPLFLKLFQKF